MKTKNTPRPLLTLALVASILSTAPSAKAVNYFWDENGATAGFGTAGTVATNWSSTTSLFSTSSAGTTAVSGTQTSTTADTIFLGTGATGLGTGTITVSGTTPTGSIHGSSTSGNITITGGTLNLGTAATIFSTTNNKELTINSLLTGTTGPLSIGTISSTISGVPMGGQGLGTVVLTGANTFNRTVVISNGKASVSSIGSVGSASSNLGAPTDATLGRIVMNSNGSLIYTGTGETTDRQIDFSSSTAGSGGRLNQSGTGLLKFTSGVVNTGSSSKTLFLEGATAGTGEISGAISDRLAVTATTSVTKNGSGTWTLSGSNTYTGATTVAEGTLLVNGTTAAGSTVTVDRITALRAGTLGGSGIVNGDLIVNNSGTLAPGSSIESLGAGSLTLNTGSTFAFELNTTTGTADLLYAADATAGLSLNGTVTLTLSDLGGNIAVAPGTKYTLISYNTAWNNGTFAGYADGSTFSFAGNTWQINYADTVAGSNYFTDANSFGNSFVTMTAVPEPSAALLLTGAFVALAFTRRLRRR